MTSFLRRRTPKVRDPAPGSPVAGGAGKAAKTDGGLTLRNEGKTSTSGVKHRDTGDSTRGSSDPDSV